MIEEILRTHASRYPLMQPEDAVKLLYQNEFGIGHLIPSTKDFADRLQREMDETPTDPRVPLTEEIGNGLVRVMLASPFRLPADELTLYCLNTAVFHHGTRKGLMAKLKILELLCGEGFFSFSTEELTLYLEKYAAAGCPPVSHSPVYREAYHPAYRVVVSSLGPKLPNTSR